MNADKAAFFDSQTESEWSSSDYTETELMKIHRILVAAGIQPGSRVIEPGCGTGRLTRIMSQLVGPRGHVLASEISPKMLEKARMCIGDTDNVELFLGPIEDFYLEKHSFDAVVCHNVFPHFDDKPSAVLRLAHGLKLHGSFVVSHFMNSSGVNDLHRKTNPAVARDFLPCDDEMKGLFAESGLVISYILDDEHGYLLKALRQ